MPFTLRTITISLALAVCVAGCGSSSSSSTHAAGTASGGKSTSRPSAPTRPLILHASRTFSLPDAREGTATALFGSSIIVNGGISSAGSSTSTSFHVDPVGGISSGAPLPSPIHDAAAAQLAGRLLVLGGGGETSAGTPTPRAWSVDPASHAVTPLPDLPVPTDHAAGAVLGGRFYLLGGLRNGVFTNAVLSWAPGDRRWRTAGHLPTAL